MSFWETLFATAAGGVIAVVGGVITQLLVAKHERERETETGKRYALICELIRSMRRS